MPAASSAESLADATAVTASATDQRAPRPALVRRTRALLVRQFRAELALKVRLYLALAVGFQLLYFALQRITIVAPRRFTPTVLDSLVPFQPGWIWVYQSAYLLIPLAPFLALRREELWRYARGFVLLSTAGFLTFLLYPVAGPRPAGVIASGLYGVVTSYDRPLNAFPSLHVALAAYSTMFGARLVRQVPSPSGWALVGAGWMWTLLVMYATLATKQHYAIDLPAGLLLAWAAHRVAWRGTAGAT